MSALPDQLSLDLQEPPRPRKAQICNWCGGALGSPAHYLIEQGAWECDPCHERRRSAKRQGNLPAGFDFRVARGTMVDWDEEVAFDRLVNGGVDYGD
jgi:hypothetical protein